MRNRSVVGLTLFAVIVVAVVALAMLFRLPVRLPPVPLDQTTSAEVPGIPGARYWVGVDLEPLVRDAVAARERERAYLAQSGTVGETLPPADLLALSGGGDKGAFGAGILNGWTAAGNRPTFKVVTGVSTGALSAPFAFLGPEYDDELKQVYTSVSPTDILEPRSIIAAIQSDGMADNRPLWTLISEFIDEDLLARIAAEHEKGRILLIGTTNLDARQPVIWNMGKIAASGAPGSLDLFRSILLASAAIPGAFPPTMVRVEIDGHVYEEMHVDGGASAQVFLYPPAIRSTATSLGEEMTRSGHVYVIRNSSLSASWAPVERRTINIAGRAIDSLIHTQGIGDLYRIYLTTQRDGFDFNLAYIGADFVYAAERESFDTAYMNALYDYGFRLGKEGYPWQNVPPGFDSALGQP